MAKSRQSPKMMVVFRKKDAWILTALKKLVEKKKASGFRTSLSHEMVRLAKNSIMKTMVGAKLDREILKDDSST